MLRPNTHFISKVSTFLRSEDAFPVVTTSKGCLMFETVFGVVTGPRVGQSRGERMSSLRVLTMERVQQTRGRCWERRISR